MHQAEEPTVVTNPLTFPHGDTVPAPGGAIEVAPGILWLRMPLPFALDHINLWLLRDGDGWVAVDAGYGIDEVRELWARIDRDVLDGMPITRIVVTHFHPDHVGLAAWLCERFDAPMSMTAGEFYIAQWGLAGGGLSDTAEQDRFYRSHGLEAERSGELAARGNTYRRGVPALPVACDRLVAGDRLSIGGRSWEVLVGHGHSPEHAMLHCAEEAILISGDQVLPRITTNIGVWHAEPDGDPLTRYLDSLDQLRALDPDTLILPSHGRVFGGLHARLQALVDHHDARLAEVVAACATPTSAAALMATLFRRPLDLHQLRFAMGEAIAHANHLQAQGRLVRTLDADGIYRFERAAARVG